MTIFAYANVNFGRPAAGQRADFHHMREAGAKVIGMVELRIELALEKWNENQPERRDGTDGSEGIFTHQSVKVRRMRHYTSALRRFGHRIGWRNTVITVVEVEGVGRVAYVLIHMPPLRMRGLLYRAYAFRLRQRLVRLNREGIPWIVAGDWNWLLNQDPADLHEVLGAKWYGKRIDGFAVHPDLVKHVKRSWTWQNPNRHDNHPECYLEVA